jgi:hypothetical protein
VQYGLPRSATLVDVHRLALANGTAMPFALQIPRSRSFQGSDLDMTLAEAGKVLCFDRVVS